MSKLAKTKLPIINNYERLRGDSRYLKEQVWGSEQSVELPRALRSLAQIVDNDLCHRCGSCVGICPTAVLRCDDDEYPAIENLSACTDCDLCVRVCPGDEFNYPAMTSSFHDLVSSNEPNLADTHGHFKQGILAYASDPKLREAATSGGLVTAVLLGLLQAGKIDGAVSIVSDETTLWKGKPIIARTESELWQALKSKYAITATNQVFSEILNTPGRYALVGLPCQIHGFHKAAALNAKLKERVVLTIALFCHAAIEHEAFRVVWGTLPEDVQNSAQRFVSRIGKHPGAPYVELQDGSYYPVYFGHKSGYRPTSIEMINMLYRLYTPKRCMTCFDALGEFADLAVGDPWMAPPEDDINFSDGWSFALLRTPKAVNLISELREQGIIEVRETTESESRACNRGMSHEKRLRAWSTLAADRKDGLPQPEYGIVVPQLAFTDRLKAQANAFTHIFCFKTAARARVLRFILSDWGYPLLYVNRLRRDLKFAWRDWRAYVKRKLIGR